MGVGSLRVGAVMGVATVEGVSEVAVIKVAGVEMSAEVVSSVMTIVTVVGGDLWVGMA